MKLEIGFYVTPNDDKDLCIVSQGNSLEITSGDTTTRFENVEHLTVEPYEDGSWLLKVHQNSIDPPVQE